MGHATRIIPLIYNLLNENYEIIIGVTKTNFAIFEEEFPSLKKVLIPAYNIKYSKHNSQIFKILITIPRILSVIIREFIFIKNLNKTEQFDLIISDNRFGLRTKNIHCVYITHQLFIKIPKYVSVFENIINKINKYFIQKFDELWIPDFEGIENLSGELSHKKAIHKNQKFIGILSRFEKYDLIVTNYKRDVLVILSGPEPQKSLFEKLIVNQLLETDFSALIVAANPENYMYENLNEQIKRVNHLSSKILRDEILNSKFVISRAGYSTIMDLYTLNKPAILLPTPGQTEQEYLAEYLKHKDLFIFELQNHFDLKIAISKLKI